MRGPQSLSPLQKKYSHVEDDDAGDGSSSIAPNDKSEDVRSKSDRDYQELGRPEDNVMHLELDCEPADIEQRRFGIFGLNCYRRLDGTSSDAEKLLRAAPFGCAIAVLLYAAIRISGRLFAYVVFCLVAIVLAYAVRKRYTAEQLRRQRAREREERALADEAMMRDANELMLNITREHLEGFLREHPSAAYEDWIRNMHPEAVEEGESDEKSSGEIDHRYYVEDSDHRIIWNASLREGDGRPFVPVRNLKGVPWAEA